MCIQLRLLIGFAALSLTGLAWQQVVRQRVVAEHVLAKPVLPFPDNADSRQCGIPNRLGDTYEGQLSGVYGGQMVEPLVYLYDSHARDQVVARVKSGTKARGVLLVVGPQLNYLLVKTDMNGRTVQGWVPEPFFTTDTAPRL